MKLRSDASVLVGLTSRPIPSAIARAARSVRIQKITLENRLEELADSALSSLCIWSGKPLGLHEDEAENRNGVGRLFAIGFAIREAAGLFDGLLTDTGEVGLRPEGWRKIKELQRNTPYRGRLSTH